MNEQYIDSIMHGASTKVVDTFLGDMVHAADGCQDYGQFRCLY